MAAVDVLRRLARAAVGVTTSELGAPGTRVTGGQIVTEEYVPELIGARMFDVYERMRRSDPTVKAMLLALKLPLLSAEWDVAAGTDGTNASGAEIAEHLATNLFDGMSVTWGDHLREVLTHLDFGFSVFEVMWDTEVVRKGQTWWEIHKLSPRLQRTIAKWHVERDGGLTKITQRIYGAPSAGTADIPIEQLLVFSHEKEGANWTGVSAIRAAYKPWFLKDQKERFQAIQAERHAVGVPVMRLPAGKDDPANIERAEDILMGVRSHERGFVVELHGYEFRFEGAGEGRVLDMLPQLNYHDRQIALGVLAQFLALGSGEGSHALSEDQTSFFLLAEKAVAQHVLDVHNRYLIPRWVAFNYGRLERYPKLRVGRIETRALEKLWNALANAAGQQLITPDDVLEDALRKEAGLPPRDPSTARKREKPAPAPRPQPEGEPPGTQPPPAPDEDEEEEEETA